MLGKESNPVHELERAYARHRQALRSFFKTVTHGRSHSVEDLVHDVYLRLLEYPPSQTLREPQAYLFKLAWSELHRHNHRQAREPIAHDPQDLERLSDEANATPGPEDSTATVEDLLIKVVGELPPIYGEVFLMFKWDGRSYAEIAQEMKLSTRQVKRYIARTLERLKCAQRRY